MGKIISHTGIIECFDQLSDLNNEALLLCQKAMASTEQAYAPYSNYKVGAALKLADGTYVVGNNQENAVYPLGLCAERVTIYAATSANVGVPIVSLAVATHKILAPQELPPFPCGSCRQVLLEVEERYGQTIDIYIVGSNSSVCIAKGAKQLIPFAFSKESL